MPSPWPFSSTPTAPPPPARQPLRVRKQATVIVQWAHWRRRPRRDTFPRREVLVVESIRRSADDFDRAVLEEVLAWNRDDREGAQRLRVPEDWIAQARARILGELDNRLADPRRFNVITLADELGVELQIRTIG